MTFRFSVRSCLHYGSSLLNHIYASFFIDADKAVLISLNPLQTIEEKYSHYAENGVLRARDD